MSDQNQSDHLHYIGKSSSHIKGLFVEDATCRRSKKDEGSSSKWEQEQELEDRWMTSLGLMLSSKINSRLGRTKQTEACIKYCS